MNECPSCGLLDGRHVATCQTPEAIAYWRLPSRHAADLWATPLRDLREALTDLWRVLAHVTWDHTLGRRYR